MPLLATLLHAALLLLAAPVLACWMRYVADRVAGRPAAPIAQAWHDLRRLWRKQRLHPTGAGPVFAAAPTASLAATAAAALLVPSLTLGMATAPLSDLLAIAGLMAVPVAAMLLAAFEAGAAISAQRDMLPHLMAAPAILLLILSAVLLTGTTALDTAAALLRDAGPRLPTLLAFAGLAVLLLSRAVPAPNIYAGRDLAVLGASEWVRNVLLLSLVGTFFLPFGLAQAGSGLSAWLIGTCCWVLKIAALGSAQAALTPFRARLRASRAPELAALVLLLAALAAAALFAAPGTA